MNAEQLEVALRNHTLGSPDLSAAERMHIILMLHGHFKPSSGGGYRIHVAPLCLQVVHGESCGCQQEGDVVWFQTGCGKKTKMHEIQPIVWRDAEFASRRKTRGDANRIAEAV